jgi:hypothetical protein
MNALTSKDAYAMAEAYERLRKLAYRLERLRSGASMHYTASGHENGDPQAPLTARERRAKKSLRSQQKASRRANRG